MSSKLYALYMKDVIALARTIVIKSEETAIAINTHLREQGYVVNDLYPETWKYYLNLSGEYGLMDVPMTVTSFDTLEEVPFTKATLREHKATAKAYVYGTPYYQALLDRYPDQELLITGILHPIDVQTAIAAPNHQILWYDKSLVEEQETNLIDELQTWIEAYFRRWYNGAYSIYHELYNAASLMVVYGHLPETILGIRLRNCHTNRAHSFHIWTYLAGHGNLDVYRDYLSLKQALWLYRNIRYVNNNAGKQHVLEDLIEIMLTDRGIPAVSYELIHDTSNMPAQLTPDVKMIPTPLNFKDQQGQSLQYKSVAQIVELENSLARQNEEYGPEEVESATYKMRHSMHSRLPTKVIEANAIDRSGSEVFTFADVILHHWAYLSNQGLYRTILSLTNPVTGAIFTMSVKDAFILYLYGLMQTFGFTLDIVPSFQARHVRKLRVPTFATLRALVSPKYVTDAMINKTYEGLPPLGLTVSTEGFYELCVALHKNMLDHYWSYATLHHLHARADYEQVVEHHNQHIELNLGDDQLYTEWFVSKGLDFSSLQRGDWEILTKEVFNKATGSDLSKRYTLRDIQGAALRLMTQLCSYTVQFISTTSSEVTIPVGTPPMRIGDVLTEGNSHRYVRIPDMRVLDVSDKHRTFTYVGLAKESVTLTTHERHFHSAFFDVGIAIRYNQVPVTRRQVLVSAPRFRLVETTKFGLPPDLAMRLYNKQLNNFDGY